MKEPKYDVYRLEVFEQDYGHFKGRLWVDVVIADLGVLRKNVYEAMMCNCGELWITYLGARRLITCCAQFDAEYMI